MNGGARGRRTRAATDMAGVPGTSRYASGYVAMTPAGTGKSRRSDAVKLA